MNVKHGQFSFTCHWIFHFYTSNYWILSSQVLLTWWFIGNPFDGHLCDLCACCILCSHTKIHKGSANPSRKKEPDHVIYLYFFVGDKVGVNLVKYTILQASRCLICLKSSWHISSVQLKAFLIANFPSYKACLCAHWSQWTCKGVR